MDPVTLGALASIVTILTFVYVIIFGQPALLDWLQQRRPKARSGGRNHAQRQSQ